MSEKNKGIFFIICAAVFFSLMTVFVRLAGDLPTMEKVLFRNLVASVVSWGMIIKAKTKLSIGKKDWFDLFMRSICGSLGMVCNFYAIDHLNISDANMLNKLSPFFAILMSILILNERVKLWEWITVFVAFIGAVLVIKPGFAFTSQAAFIGLLGGLGAGIAYTFVRRLGKRNVDGKIIVMFFSTFTTIFTLPFFIVGYVPMTPKQLLCLFLAGICATGGQFSITAAYTHAPAKEISVYDYSQVIFAAIWGFFLFDQVPDIFSVIGYVVIIGAAVIRFKMGNKT